jgi:antitoxin component YwqK of YwqJK toxin-antitoxin module
MVLESRCSQLYIVVNHLRNKLKATIMNNKFLLIIFFIFFIACVGQRDISADREIEVKFIILKSKTKYPEYELIFLSEGKVIATRVYKKGQMIVSDGVIPDNQVVEKYENGKIKNIIHYKNGKREGKAIGFYQSGKVKIESTYKNDNPVGITKTFHETGHLKSESEIVGGKKNHIKNTTKTVR